MPPLFSVVQAVFTQIWKEKENEFLMVAHFLKEKRILGYKIPTHSEPCGESWSWPGLEIHAS